MTLLLYIDLPTVEGASFVQCLTTDFSNTVVKL